MQYDANSSYVIIASQPLSPAAEGARDWIHQGRRGRSALRNYYYTDY